jgi:hypothetical protein
MNQQEALIDLQKVKDISQIAIKIMSAYECCDCLHENFENLTLEDTKNIHSVLISIINETKDYLTFIQPEFAKKALELFELLYNKCNEVLKQ